MFGSMEQPLLGWNQYFSLEQTSIHQIPMINKLRQFFCDRVTHEFRFQRLEDSSDCIQSYVCQVKAKGDSVNLLIITEIVLYSILMNRRISKSTTNYQIQKDEVEQLFKKQSLNSDSWKAMACDQQLQLASVTHNLSLFFDSPQLLLSSRRLEHRSETQSLREGVYILLRGKIRVLISQKEWSGSQYQIDTAIRKMSNSSKGNLSGASKRFTVIQVTEAYQVVLSCNNCIALPETYYWFISPEELAKQQFHENFKRVQDLIAGGKSVFSTHLMLPFTVRLMTLTFRGRVELPEGVELGILRKGCVLVQWRGSANGKLVIPESSILIKSNQYDYYCHSADIEVILIRSNKTYRFIDEPLWTKITAVNYQPPFKKSSPKAKAEMLFRSRSINIQRLTTPHYSLNKQNVQRSACVSPVKNRPDSSISVRNLGQTVKQQWIFMRNVQSYQVASNTRSQVEYSRLQSIKDRFRRQREREREREREKENAHCRKQNVQQDNIRSFPFHNEALVKKQMKTKVKFHSLKEGNSVNQVNAHFGSSSSSFFEVHSRQ